MSVRKLSQNESEWLSGMVGDKGISAYRNSLPRAPYQTLIMKKKGTLDNFPSKLWRECREMEVSSLPAGEFLAIYVNRSIEDGSPGWQYETFRTALGHDHRLALK